MHIGRFQVIGLVGLALFVMGASTGIVLPQLSPPVYSPVELSWAFFVGGGFLFWVGVIGGIVDVIRGTPTRTMAAPPGPLSPPK